MTMAESMRASGQQQRIDSWAVLNTLSNWNEPHIGELFSGCCCGSILVAAFAIPSSLSICVGNSHIRSTQR